MAVKKRSGVGHSQAVEQIKVEPLKSEDTKLSNCKGDTIKIKKRKGKKESQAPKYKRSASSVFVSSLKYILLIIVVPPFINYASLQKEYTMLKPAEGELYDIGHGQKLFMMCEGKGPPTVILDAPTGMTSDVWSLVWPKISKHGRVCIYDRAGLGFSERPFVNTSQQKSPDYNGQQWEPYTAERMVDDLNRLFTLSSQQPQPFILVGAELGALVSMFYSQVYEGQVLGLVLVNPLSSELFKQDNGVWSQYWFGQLIPTYQSFQLGAALGLTRLALMFGILKHPLTGTQMPQEVELRQKYLMCNPRHLSSVVDEHHFINETFSQMRVVQIIRQVPLNITVEVLSGNYYDEQLPSALNKAWAKSELSLISSQLPHAKHVLINGADHHMLYKKPSTIVDHVVKIIKIYKNKHKLE